MTPNKMILNKQALLNDLDEVLRTLKEAEDLGGFLTLSCQLLKMTADCQNVVSELVIDGATATVEDCPAAEECPAEVICKWLEEFSKTYRQDQKEIRKILTALGQPKFIIKRKE